VTIYCDNKSALHSTFHCTAQGITPFCTADYNLIHLAKYFIQCLPITTLGTWVKGHYSGKNKQIEHDLNHTADQLATPHRAKQSPPYKGIKNPPTYPGYKIRLIHSGSPLTSKFYTKITQALHEQNLITFILCRTNWTPRIFSSVNWEAHRRAFQWLTKDQQIPIAKLIHQQANTNRQNHLFYKTSPLCPCCQTEDETFEHLLTCSSPEPALHRTQAMEQLKAILVTINTPEKVTKALLLGIQQWIDKTSSYAPTFGSLSGLDILLADTWSDQRCIGWYNLCLGQLSLKWNKTVQAYTHASNVSLDTDHWASLVIYLRYGNI
jgi:hypothetical protein